MEYVAENLELSTRTYTPVYDRSIPGLIPLVPFSSPPLTSLVTQVERRLRSSEVCP